MKKQFSRILMVAATCIALSAGTTMAQNGRFSVGAELGLPMGDFGDIAGIGFGGTIGYEYPVGDALGIGLRAGYETYAGKDFFDGINFNHIPIQAFAKYYFQGEAQSGFYGMVNLGVHMGSSSVEGSESTTDLSYAPEIGYHLDNLDFGARYQMIATEGSTTSYLGVRIAYVFGEK